ncbi:uncharacterized protein F5891DRAFT_947122, partial [Suillus fuscotomentosus]
CHTMTPHFGAGAGQAIEVDYVISLCTRNAFVLGRLLAHPLTTSDNLPAALKAYQEVHLPFAQFVARESGRRGRMWDFELSSTVRGEVQEELKIQKEKLLAQWEWEGKDRPVAEWLEAERKLQESIGVTNKLLT